MVILFWKNNHSQIGWPQRFFFVDFSSEKMCIFVSRPMKIVTFLLKNRDHPKRVIDFHLERDTFRNQIIEIVDDFDEKSYNNNGKPWKIVEILHLNPFVFIFLSFFNIFLHFFVFFIFHFFPFFSLFHFVFHFSFFFHFFSFSFFVIFFIFFIFSFFPIFYFGVSHDSPRTPNVYKRGSQNSKTPPNSTRRHPKRPKRNEMGTGEGKKKARNFVPPPFGLPPFHSFSLWQTALPRTACLCCLFVVVVCCCC